MVFLWIFHIICPAFALQHSTPFARHFYVSSATTVDREFGSGVLQCNVPELQGNFMAGTRHGEASHPGPVTAQDSLLVVGTSNPGGLRSKEDLRWVAEYGL